MIWGHHRQGWTFDGGDQYLSHAFRGRIPKGFHWEFVDLVAKSNTALCGVIAGQGWYGHREPHSDAPACYKCKRLAQGRLKAVRKKNEATPRNVWEHILRDPLE